MTGRLLLTVILATTASCTRSRTDRPLRVAAAASLADAFGELGQSFTRRSGHAVTIVPGASGKLATQIIQGAPFDVFASADASWIDRTITEGATVANTRTRFALGRLAIWSPRGAPGSLQELAAPRYKKIALANVEHAPYGRAAREALQRAGLWKELEPRLVFGANVRQAQQFAQTGNAELTLTALPLVIGREGEYLLVAADQHAPLEQVAVVCGRAPNPARARSFVELLTSRTGRAILERYGLRQPEIGMR